MKKYTIMGFETFEDIEARNDESAINKGRKICKANKDVLREVSAQIVFKDGKISEEERCVYRK